MAQLIPVAAFLFCGFLLFVTAKTEPIITNNNTEYIIPDGKSTVIHCKTKDNTTLSVRWEIGGKLYNQTKSSETNGNFNVSGNSTLVITNRLMSQMYGLVNVTCIVNNTGGTSSRTFRVVFMKVATITTNMKTYDVPDDGSTEINLNCAAHGFPSPKITWSINGFILSEGVTVTYHENGTKSFNVTVFDNESLKIVLTSQRNEGFGRNVTCIANNTVGFDRRIYLVRFLKEPIITNNNTEYIIPDGKSTVIHCKTKDNTTLSVRWEIGGKLYNQTKSSETNGNFNVSGNSTLVITNRLMSQMYGLVNVTCIVNNTGGTSSRTFRVVFMKVATITTNMKTYDVPDDGSTEINLNCAAHGFPSPKITWSINGFILSEGVTVTYHENGTKSFNVTVFDNESLKIVLTSQRNEGFGRNVTCIANNTVGFDRRIYLVRFLKAPRILTNSSDITVHEYRASFVYINCETTGYPKPYIEWVFGNEKLNASYGRLLGASVLHVVDGVNVLTRSYYRVFSNGTIRIDNPLSTTFVPHEKFTCVARNIAGHDSRAHDFYIGPIESYSFKVWLSNEVTDVEKYVLTKIENAFEPLKLLSHNITSTNSTAGTVGFQLDWADKNLERYGKPVDTTALASDVHKALTNENGTLKRLIIKTKPGPATDLTVADVTSSKISFSWKRPSEYFEVDFYNVQLNGGSRFRNVKNSVYETRATLDDLDADSTYLIKVESVNYEQELSVSKELQVKTKAAVPVLIIVLVVVFVLAAIVVLVAVILYRRRRRILRERTSIILGEENPYEHAIPGVPLTNIYVRENKTFCPTGSSDEKSYFSWNEIPRDSLTMSDVLGQGEFGLVQKAMWWDGKKEVAVAVKTVKDIATETDRKELFKELKLMAEIEKHPNVVNLVGACSKRGPMWIVVEFCENGDLIGHLKKNRKTTAGDGSFTTSLELLSRIRIAYDVAKGMHHLQEKKIVHRDLAARNVLLGKNKIAKVSDFGLSRDIYERGLYEKKTGGKLPVKWMAIESLQEAAYNSKSDVWSFGVLFWEIETAGMVPYPGIPGLELMAHLRRGARLNQPSETPFEIYEIMMSCWDVSPNQRPDFQQLESKLEFILMSLADYLDVVVEDNNANDPDGKASYVNYNTPESADDLTAL